MRVVGHAQVVEAVVAADEVADLVVVTVHWGIELDTTPRQDDIERAEAMIDAGILDGDEVGSHSGMFVPFEVDVTDRPAIEAGRMPYARWRQWCHRD